ncbi:MAG: low molecular weight protein-tyrosine-phosphatase [Paracoccaceae bacterium]
MTARILFVCLGNICRSPTAEGVTRVLAARAGLDLTVDSAGTGAWHVGEAPCPGMVRAAAGAGYDISRLRARQMKAADFAAFDLIVAMDGDNLDDIAAQRPTGATTEVRLFTHYAPETGVRDVPDAYYTRDYTGALALIETCAAGLVATLARP